MKKTLLFFAAMIASIGMMAQAPVPTSWDCAGALPTGYSETELTSSNSYVAPLCVSTPASYKMDRTGEALTLWVNDVPGALSYQLRGTGSGTWSGTMTVQESVDGSIWTTLHTYTNADVNTTSFILQTDIPNTTSRYIRFFYTNKVSGFNLAIDDIAIAIPSAGPAQEIAANFSTANVANNSTIYFASPVGTASPIVVNLENLGTVNTLNITSAIISGVAASDYSITSSPSSVSALGTAPINITFNPSMAGTRAAILTIVNDDADENPFVINLNGIGGSFATEPLSNPTALSFTNIKAWKMTARWVKSTADGFIVLRKEGSAVADAPVDGQVYDVGMGIGTSKVFFVGNGDSSKIQEMVANTTYHYAIFAYNGIGSFTNYKQSSPLVGSQMSTGLNAGTYYSTVDSNAASFVTDLTSKINNHFQIFYSDYDNTIVPNYFLRDTTGDDKVFNCDYSGETKIFTPPFGFVGTNSSREHCFASSWMPTFGTTGHEDKEAYSDLFNLKLANQDDVNAPRSNRAFGQPLTSTTNYLLATFGTDAVGHKVFSPRTDFRGDVARSIFYMTTCYHNADNDGSINSWSWNSIRVAASFGDTAWTLSSKLNQSLMKQWAQLDPPSNEEMARAEYIYSIQNNRNPYIDNPSWICLVDFNTMNKTANCNVGINDVDATIHASVYPNPTADFINIDLDEKLSNDALITIADMTGKIVFEVSTDATASTINTSSFAKGMYTLTISSEGRMMKKKIIVQ
jgi:endonuclease I